MAVALKVRSFFSGEGISVLGYLKDDLRQYFEALLHHLFLLGLWPAMSFELRMRSGLQAGVWADLSDELFACKRGVLRVYSAHQIADLLVRSRGVLSEF